jgi:alpha-N-arabinofuranosidase
MLLTPTYYVFDLYKYHQDATLLPVNFYSPEYKFGNDSIPAINASASKDSNGVIHITIVNLDPKNKISISTNLNGANFNQATGEVLTSANFTDVNTFDNSTKVKATAFTDLAKNGDALTVNLLPMSVTLITLK